MQFKFSYSILFPVSGSDITDKELVQAGLRGFIGCLSSVQFNQATPLKAALQNSQSPLVTVIGRLEASSCGKISSSNTLSNTHIRAGKCFFKCFHTAKRLNDDSVFQPFEKNHKSQSFIFLSRSFSAYRWLSKIRQRQRPNEKGRSKWLGTNRRYRSPLYCALGKTFQNDTQIIDHPQKWTCTASYIFRVISEVWFHTVLICITPALHDQNINASTIYSHDWFMRSIPTAFLSNHFLGSK